MRLLDTHTGKFVEKDPRKEEFKYAILSHTWDRCGEQTYQQLTKIQERYNAKSWFPTWSNSPPSSRIWKDHKLSRKIRDACAVARKDGYRYIWIDSCCIDKTSSSELSEAINSMYPWYEGADVCYAYLADVPPHEDLHKDHSAFRESRWFTRGWTLQELIAPWNLVFLSKNWTVLGSKLELTELVNTITGISVDALSRMEPLDNFSVAQRFSWAARRETTRVEDRAYSLLGIFGINMPTLYGEGEGAFLRLQEEILRRIPDQSFFAWGDVFLGTQLPVLDSLNPGLAQLPGGNDWKQRIRVQESIPNSFLPRSLDSFADGWSVEAVPLTQLFHHYPGLPVPDYSITPVGIRIHVPLLPLLAFLPAAGTTHEGMQSEWYLAVLGCGHTSRPGQLLGRICRVRASASGIKYLYGGYIVMSSADQKGEGRLQAELLVLSAEALARSSALATVLAVYLPLLRADRPSADSHLESAVHNRPHQTINLLLKRTNDTALGPRGTGNRFPAVPADEPAIASAVSLRWPDRDHPATHCLTLSRPTLQPTIDSELQDTITIEYRYMLERFGGRVTIVAHVSGLLQGRPIMPVTSTWEDSLPWNRWEHRNWVVLDNGEDSTMEVELTLEYLAPNHYVIDAHTEWCIQSSRLEDAKTGV